MSYYELLHQMTHILELQLELYALNRLSDDEMEIVEEHLLVCSQCREQVSNLDTIPRFPAASIGGRMLRNPATPTQAASFGELSLNISCLAAANGIVMALSCLLSPQGRARSKVTGEESGLNPTLYCRKRRNTAVIHERCSRK